MGSKIVKKDLREFAFVIGFGLPLIIGFFIPLILGHQFRMWTLLVGMIFLIIGIIKLSLLKYIYISWMKLGEILGWINSRLILGLIYLVVLLPISMIMRTTGYDPLRKKKLKVITYRENNQNHKIDLKKIF